MPSLILGGTHWFCIGPFLGRWNAFLESRFPLQISRALQRRPNAAGGLVRPAEMNSYISYTALTKRVAADQLIMAPLGVSLSSLSRFANTTLNFLPAQLVLFIGSMGMMEGRTRSQINQKYRDLYGEAIIANWKVWPLAQVGSKCLVHDVSVLNTSSSSSTSDTCPSPTAFLSHKRAASCGHSISHS